MFWLHGRKLLPSTALKLTNMGLMFASPLLLQQLMKAVEDGEPRGTCPAVMLALPSLHAVLVAWRSESVSPCLCQPHKAVTFQLAATSAWH